MADLSSALAGTSLDASSPLRYHVLHIAYPALHLIPNGAEPYLDPPKDHVQRERPRLGLYHLTPSNLSFFHRFPVGSGVADSCLSMPGIGIVAADFVATVNALAAVPGQSRLEFASFGSPENGIQHILRLTVDKANEQGAITADTRQYTFLLSDEQLTGFFLQNIAQGAHSWLTLMSDLVHRASDRAFLHVQQQLTSHPAFALQDGSRHADKWDTMPSIPGYQALMSRLTIQLPDSGPIALDRLDAENLASHAHQSIEVRLPCGHAAKFRYERLRAMADKACLHAECRACKQQTLSYEQTVALVHRIERTARHNCYWEEVDLDALDGPVEKAGPKIEISVHEIRFVLEDVLRGLEVPESATPAALSLAGVSETQGVLLALQRDLRSLGGSLVVKPVELFRRFEVMAMRALLGDGGRERAEMPPGILEFVERWLRRTVNHLAGVERAFDGRGG